MGKNICVFCSSSDVVAPVYFEAAKNLGKLIAKNGYSLLYGGAKIGLMGALAKKVKKQGGQITGIIPETLFNMGLAYEECNELIKTKDMAERKLIMEDKADAFIAMPGGFGTLEEILQVITLKQLQYLNKPVVFLNVNSFYSGLISLFENLYKEKFAKENYRDLYFVSESSEQALDYINNYKPYEYGKKWF